MVPGRWPWKRSRSTPRARKLMGELEELSADVETWLPKLKVLSENVEQHIKEEEEKVLPRAEEVFPQSRWRSGARIS